jgi:GTP cyclohydrolase II
MSPFDDPLAEAQVTHPGLRHCSSRRELPFRRVRTGVMKVADLARTAGCQDASGTETLVARSGPHLTDDGRAMSHPEPNPSAAASLAAAPVLDPGATVKIRMEVSVPLRFVDGYATDARVFTFDGLADGGEHIALGLGPWQAALERSAGGGPAPLVRPHSECLTGDVFGSQRCDCGAQLREAVEQIAEAGGFLLYLRQEGRGIGLYAKLDAYALQDAGLDTYEANVALGHGEDERDYTVAAEMLHALGADRVALLSNNPDKAAQLERLGVRVTEQIATGVHLSEANVRYLAAKVSRAGHTLDLPAIGRPERAS